MHYYGLATGQIVHLDYGSDLNYLNFIDDILVTMKIDRTITPCLQKNSSELYLIASVGIQNRLVKKYTSIGDVLYWAKQNFDASLKRNHAFKTLSNIIIYHLFEVVN